LTNDLPTREKIINLFNEFCRKLKINNPNKINEVVIYLMIDGTRTSSPFEGKEAYIDGSNFAKRFIHILNAIGGKACYINVFEEFHRNRENYSDTYNALKDVVPEWKTFAEENGIRLRFIGNFNKSFSPNNTKDDFIGNLRKLEHFTDKNKFNAHILINFSIEWALENKELFKDVPTINSIIRFTKGQGVPESMLIPGKVEHESLVYVQQGSSSENWSDRQIIFLAALALRANVRNMPYFIKSLYKDEEDEGRIRKEREEERIFINEDLYDKKDSKKPKVAVIFSEVGPERYIF